MRKADLIEILVKETSYSKSELTKMKIADLQEMVDDLHNVPEDKNGLEYDEDYAEQYTERSLVDKVDDFTILPEDFDVFDQVIEMTYSRNEFDEEEIEVDLAFDLDKEQKENHFGLSKAELRRLKRAGML